MGEYVTVGQLEQEGINHDAEWNYLMITDAQFKKEFWEMQGGLICMTDICRAITNWCIENFSGRFHRFGRVFWIEKDSDAVMFRMSWDCV